MRIRCFLREIRGERTLSDIVNAVQEHGSKVNHGELSRIENGIALPRDEIVEALALVYGASPLDWYPPAVLWAIESGDDQLADIKRRLRTTLQPRDDAVRGVA